MSLFYNLLDVFRHPNALRTEEKTSPVSKLCDFEYDVDESDKPREQKCIAQWRRSQKQFDFRDAQHPVLPSCQHIDDVGDGGAAGGRGNKSFKLGHIACRICLARSTLSRQK